MAKSYAATLAEIEKLQAEAERLRKSEMSGVIARIREAIDVYGITAEDLEFSGDIAPRKSPSTPPPKPSSSTGVAKYRDPQSGKTWTGRGKPPAWIAAARDREAFAIDATPAKAAGPKAKTPATKAASGVGQPKYRDPKTGKTWTGRGKPPLWIASKKNREVFAIDAPAAAGTGSEAPSATDAVAELAA